MLIYKFHDSFSNSRVTHRCEECKRLNSCYWHKFKKNPRMDACGDIQFTYKNQEITPKNANWLLFQIGRSIELSKNIIIQRKSFAGIELLAPESMRSNHLPDFDECDAYVKILAGFLKTISSFEKSIKGQREEKIRSIKAQKKLIDEEENGAKKTRLEAKCKKLEAELLSLDNDIGRFVGSIIETTVRVKGKDVSIFSDGEDFVDIAKAVADSSGYNFFRTKNNGEAKAWLGQITNAN